VSQLDDLVERVRTGVGARNPEHVALAIRVATDITVLQGRASLGEDVAAEMAHARAAALQLTEHGRNVIGREVIAFVQNVIAGALIA
jgi:hypothetical protein